VVGGLVGPGVGCCVLGFFVFVLTGSVGGGVNDKVGCALGAGSVGILLVGIGAWIVGAGMGALVVSSISRKGSSSNWKNPWRTSCILRS